MPGKMGYGKDKKTEMLMMAMMPKPKPMKKKGAKKGK